jgi:hypothetical protein
MKIKNIFLILVALFWFTAPKAQITTDTGVKISGVIWATRNVDAPGTFAENPESAGMFYQWNRQVGWSSTDPLVNSNNETEWNSTMPEGTEWESAKDPCPLGWRLPNLTELKSVESSPSLDIERVTQNSTYGFKFTDRITGNSIFLPAAGYRNGSEGSLLESGSAVYFRSGTGYYQSYNGGIHTFGTGYKNYGYSCRCVKDTSSAISEVPAKNISVYPNPAKDGIIIENAALKTENIVIFDLSGRGVLQTPAENGKINVSHLQPGIYFVKIGTYTGKFVKE